jgi:hypothetical protein
MCMGPLSRLMEVGWRVELWQAPLGAIQLPGVHCIAYPPVAGFAQRIH